MTAVATVTTTQQIVELPLEQLRPSERNIRRHYDPAKLKELIRSIQQKGVLTPLLVRPAGKGYEIAAGHRRYDAAKKAGLKSVPAIVRDMDDVEFLELVTIENLQREDVHPLDEGLGYRQLMTAAGYTVEMVAEKVGKSVSYIYQRLKLAELIPALQKPFLMGELTASHAILIARLQSRDQERAAKEGLYRQEWIGRTGHIEDWEDDGDRQIRSVRSVRELEAWIQQNILLDLHRVPWKKDDADLVPEAGPCTTCPKRTGNDPQLFPDVKKGDTCTDGQCFALKMARFIDRKAQELAASSPRLVFRISANYRTKSKDVLGEDAYREIRPGETWCKSATKAVFVDGKRTGQAVTVCADSKCKEHFGGGYGGAQHTAAEKAKRRQEARRRTVEQHVRRQMLDATLEAVPPRLDAFTRPQLVFVATALYNDVGYDDRKQLCIRHHLEPAKKQQYGGTYKDYEAPVRRLIPTLEGADLVRFIVECALVGDASVSTYGLGSRRDLLEAAKVFKVNVAGIERAVQKAFSEKAKRIKNSAPRPKRKVQTSAKARK